MNTVETKNGENAAVAPRVKGSKSSESGSQKKLDAATTKLLAQLKDRANKKVYGRKVTDLEVIAIALRMVGPDQLRELQEATYAQKDRLHMAHENYCKDNARITLDEFIGRLMAGKIDLSQKP